MIEIFIRPGMPVFKMTTHPIFFRDSETMENKVLLTHESDPNSPGYFRMYIPAGGNDVERAGVLLPERVYMPRPDLVLPPFSTGPTPV